MVNTISGLQGKTVYRNSSYAPTRGTNNPTGYIQRELTKQGLSNAASNQPSGNVGVFGGVSKIGADGQSDTRSGLAAGALKTTGGVGTSQSQGSPLVTGTPKLTTPDTPTAQISAIGEIKLPYNFQSNANILAEQQAAQQALLEIKQGRDQNQIKYLREISGTQNDFDETMHGIRNQAAGRGLSFSSAHGKEVSTNYGKFSDLMQQLAADQTTAENNFTQQQNAVVTGLNNTIKKELNAQGYEAMENAGEWVISKKPTPKANPKKPAAKKKSNASDSIKKKAAKNVMKGIAAPRRPTPKKVVIPPSPNPSIRVGKPVTNPGR